MLILLMSVLKPWVLKMNLNNAYNLWKIDPTPVNYDILGKALLQFVTGYVKQRMRLPQEETREDVISRSIIRVLEEFETYDPIKAPFTAWIRLKIENTKNNLLEQISNRREYPMLETDAAPDIFKGIDAKILLRQLIKTLPVGDYGLRGLIRLQLEGFSDEEIAEILGIPIGTVKSRWNRLQKRLRESAI